jgi:1-acyl-sn-glycerol-3-phosphate acyltransferase
MAGQSQFALLKQRRFLPFFLTQALGAFNDNVFKQALVALVTFVTIGLTAQDRNYYTNLAAGLFILPFFLFSATSGQLSDKYDKARLARFVKLLEVAIMFVGAVGFLRQDLTLLLAMLFMMGLHSTLFGPLKYGILPQVLRDHELTGGNGLIEMATFLAILTGTILGTSLIQVPGSGAWLVSGVTIALALAGYASARAMPPVPSEAPDLKINWNPVTETWDNLRQLARNRTVFLSCLGISWFWFYGSIYFIQLPNYTREVLGGNAGVYTLLLTIFSVGVAIGSLLCDRLSGHKVEIGLVPFGSIGMTVFGADLYFAWPYSASVQDVAPMAFVALPGAWRVLMDLALMAVFSGFFIVPLFALIQSRSEPARRSRVIAANNILNAMFMVVASVLAIVLLNMVGLTIPELLLYTALLNAVVAVYIYTLVPEFLMRFLSWIFVNMLYRLKVEGLDKVPEDGPALLVCNHVSFMDALIVGGTVRRPVRFVMYYRIFQWPFLSWVFRAARAIPIAGRKEDPAMMERAFDEVDRELADGNLVAIFPEGGITRDGAIGRFRPGVERILERRPVPVVPLALRGMWGSLFSRKDRLRLPRRFWSRIGVAFGDPLPAAAADAETLEAKVRELRGDLA